MKTQKYEWGRSTEEIGCKKLITELITKERRNKELKNKETKEIHM